MRQQMSKIVDHYIQRSSDGRLFANDSHPYFREVETRHNERYLDERQEGELCICGVLASVFLCVFFCTRYFFVSLFSFLFFCVFVCVSFVCFCSSMSGIIREEAEVRVGGAQRLEQAIASGTILQREHKGQVLFFFPSVRLGQKQLAGSTQKLERSKRTTEEGHANTQTLMRNLGWVIKGGDGEASWVICVTSR